MSREARSINKSGFFHIMVQGINKVYIFQEEIQKNKYIELMRKNKEKFNISIISYCVMDNHVHIIIYSEKVTEISKYMHRVNSLYGEYYNKTNDRVGFVFRNRFQSQYIDNMDYLLKCIKYIHMNPVKAKMVDMEEKYKYSSYNEMFGIIKNVFIDKKILISIYGNWDSILYRIKNEDEEIEIMDIDRNEENFKIAVKLYLKDNNISIEEIKKNKERLIDFSNYLLEKKYKKIQISKLLNIPKTTFLNKIKS